MANRKDTRLSGINPLAYVGVEPIAPLLFFSAERTPTVNDYANYNVGTIWLDRSTGVNGTVWILIKKDGHIATWQKFQYGNILEALVPDTGINAIPNVSDEINILGGTNIETVGTLNTITVNVDADTIADQYDTDGAPAIPSGGILEILGGTNATTSGAGNTVTIDVDGTVASSYVTDSGTATPAATVLNVLGGLNIDTEGSGNTVTVKTPVFSQGVIQADGSGVFSGSSGNDGELLTGVTGNNPIWSNLTSAGASIAITNGAGSINLEAIGGGFVSAGENINLTAPTVVNLNETIHWPDTNSAGTTGMIYLGGAGGVGGTRFMHNYSPSGAPIGGSTFLGEGAGNTSHTSTVDFNTGIGFKALNGLTTGSSNVSIGDEAGGRINTGNSNVAIGDDALPHLRSGSNNIVIGSDRTAGTAGGAGSSYTSSESSNIVLMNAGVTAESNTMRLGIHGSSNAEQNRCFIAGIRGITTGVADAITVLIDSSYQLGTASSSKKHKQNIEDMNDASSAVMKLRPVTFEYKKHPGLQQFGLIAEEVEKIFPRLVARSNDGEIETVKYHELPAILLNEMQKMSKRIADLEDKLDSLEEMV